MTKWNRFKEERASAIDRYLRQKKQNLQVQQLQIVYVLYKMESVMKENIQTLVAKYRRINTFNFLIAQIRRRWMQYYRRRGPTIEALHLGKIHREFSFYASVKFDNCYLRSKRIFYSILKECADVVSMQTKVLDCHYLLQSLFTRCIQRRAVLDAKLRTLNTFWNKMISELLAQAAELDDDEAKEIFTKINDVPEEIRKTVIKEYLSRCEQLYTIAYFQWRI